MKDHAAGLRPRAGSAPPGDPFSSGGEVTGILRGIDWSEKSVGPVSGWPQSLRTALGICLASRQPSCLVWGADRLCFYNEACQPLLGNRHPRALGESYATAWPESAQILQPLLAQVEATGEAASLDDLTVNLPPGNAPEAGTFAVSIAPARAENGVVGGALITFATTTAQAVSERRLRILGEFADRAAKSQLADDVCRLAAEILSADSATVPFAWFYLTAPDGQSARLVSQTQRIPEQMTVPVEVSLTSDDGNDLWALREAAGTLKPLVRSKLTAVAGAGETGPIDSAVVLPIACPGEVTPSGFLVGGIGPQRPLDAGYHGFLGLLAGQVALALAHVCNTGPAKNARTQSSAGTGSLSPFEPRSIPRRVLVAESNGDTRDQLTRLLKEHYDVASVPDGDAALAMVQLWQPELVLADAGMPRRNGFQFVRTLRADPQTRLIPVILLADSPSEEARVEGLEAGADDYLSRPFGARELLIRVRAQLRRTALQRSAEARIVASELRLEQLVTMLPAGIYAVDAEGRFTFFNPRAAEIWGAAPRLRQSYDEFAAQFQILDETGAPLPIERRPLSLVLREGLAINAHEATLVRPDGSRLAASISISPTFGADGRVTGAIAVFQDISAEQQARVALRETEERYRAVFQQAAVGIFECDLRGRILRGNPALSRMVGYTEAELEQMNWRDLAAPDEAPSNEQVARRLRQQELDAFNGERRLVRKDRSVIWLDVFATTVHTPADRPPYGLVILVDITERKRTEAELRETEERFRLAADNSPVLIWITAPDRRRIWFNKPWLDFVGRTLEQEIGDGWTKEIHPEDRERTTHAYMAAFETHAPVSIEFRLRRHDGVYRWMLAQGVPRHQGTEFAGYIGSCVDITARRQAEEAVHESRNAERARRQELEHARDEAVAASRAKDDFLAALSHELRTPLSPVLLLASDAATDPKLPPSVRADFETIRKSVELEARLIDDLLDLTRIVRDKITLEMRDVDVPVALRDSLVAVRAEFEAKSIALVLDLAPEPQAVRGDPVRLQQVFWNVLKNAVKFTSPGGRVTITTRVDRERRVVTVQITDTGIGMTAAEIERVFQAFSQGDHASGGGSHRFGGLGLGLAISQRIIVLHHGRISAASSGRDRGSTFCIELPLWQREPAAVPPSSEPDPTRADAPATAAPPPSKGRILLVEDHSPTRAALKNLLIRRHYAVTTAANATEARAAAQHGSFDLLVSDIGLPDGNGYELMREFRERYQLRGIALTGYGMEDDVARSRAAGFEMHLTKPVRIQHLDRALDALALKDGTP